VIGDVNESNVLAGDNALVALISTDSFQVKDSRDGKIYRCPVGKPEFTPPELQGKAFPDIDRSVEHDRFGLAVLIFHLLMEGSHPFSGIFQGLGDPPPLEKRIAEGHFIYSKAQYVPYRPSPTDVSWNVLPTNLQHLFLQCFEEGHKNPARRPDAHVWKNELRSAAKELTTCTSNQQHQYGKHLATCPWCERAALRNGLDPFPSRSTQQPQAATKPQPQAATKPQPQAAAKPQPQASVKPQPQTVAKPSHRRAWACMALAVVFFSGLVVAKLAVDAHRRAEAQKRISGVSHGEEQRPTEDQRLPEPKVEQPKTEPKVEQPKTEPKVEQPKVEQNSLQDFVARGDLVVKELGEDGLQKLSRLTGLSRGEIILSSAQAPGDINTYILKYKEILKNEDKIKEICRKKNMGIYRYVQKFIDSPCRTLDQFIASEKSGEEQGEASAQSQARAEPKVEQPKAEPKVEQPKVEIDAPDVYIVKKGPEEIRLGQTATYELTVNNKGTAVAKDLVMRDNIPAGMKFKNKTDGVPLKWPPISLEPGKSQKFSYTVEATRTGSFTNNAEAWIKDTMVHKTSVTTRVVASDPELNVEQPNTEPNVDQVNQAMPRVALSNADLEKLISKGGKAWSSVSVLGKLEGGEDFWIWPKEDHVLTYSPNERWISFTIYWRLRPGKSFPKNGKVGSCKIMSGSGMVAATDNTLEGSMSGVLDDSFDTHQYKGEGIIPFYLTTDMFSHTSPISNILLLPVKLSGK
jgi:uncharacterized repeat protein (TIGR01451 family)